MNKEYVPKSWHIVILVPSNLMFGLTCENTLLYPLVGLDYAGQICVIPNTAYKTPASDLSGTLICRLYYGPWFPLSSCRINTLLNMIIIVPLCDWWRAGAVWTIRYMSRIHSSSLCLSPCHRRFNTVSGSNFVLILSWQDLDKRKYTMYIITPVSSTHFSIFNHS